MRIHLPAVSDPALDPAEVARLVVVAEQSLVLLAQFATAFALDLTKGKDVSTRYPYR